MKTNVSQILPERRTHRLTTGPRLDYFHWCSFCIHLKILKIEIGFSNEEKGIVRRQLEKNSENSGSSNSRRKSQFRFHRDKTIGLHAHQMVY